MMTTGEYVVNIVSHVFTPPLSWPTPRNRRTREAVWFQGQRIQRMIDEYRSHHGERNDLLSLLIQSRDSEGNAMSDEQIVDECLTLYAAGHETTAVTMIWVWYLLCKHPEIYQRVQHEVDSVLQGRAPTYADLPRLPYCLQVIKETLRLYPAGYVVNYETLRDIEIDGYLLRKGQSIIVSPYLMHRKPEFYPDPERFDPERFTPEREKGLPRNSYIPFGTGPRICIGNHFSMLESHLILATLALRTSFKLLSNQERVPDIVHNLTLRPNGKVEVMIQKR